MKIIYIQGGLGNQIFQYAFFRYLIKKGHRRVYLDGTAEFISKHGGFELKRLFPAIAADKRVLPYWKARPLYLLAELFRLISDWIFVLQKNSRKVGKFGGKPIGRNIVIRNMSEKRF